MIALAADVVVMPTWVFLLFVVGGIGLITFLLWANNTQGQDLRRAHHRRVVHDHLHHGGPPPWALLVEDREPQADESASPLNLRWS